MTTERNQTKSSKKELGKNNEESRKKFTHAEKETERKDKLLP